MMEPQTSGSDDDDRENLISKTSTQNGVVSSSTFHLEEPSRTSFPSRHRRSKKNRYILILILSLIALLLLLYFTNIFLPRVPDNNNNNNNIQINQILNSELQALHLLKQQESELSNLRLLSNVSNFNLDDFKSHLFTQISLNKRIQSVLLSNNNGIVNRNETYIENADSCTKVDQRLSNRRTIDWNPKPDKYLFAICVSGQMSNHLICLEKHIFFAALLNRVLVIPSGKVDYEYQRVLDVDHVNKCVGRRVVVTFEEFAESRKGKGGLRIDRFMCYFSRPTACFVDDEHVKKLKDLGVGLSKVEAVWEEDVKMPKERKVGDVLAKFSSDVDVVAIGDVFFADVEREWVMQPGGPIAHRCKTLIEPSRLILLTAQRFVQTFLGKNFVALHFRRHGFLKFCNAKKPSCFYPIPQAAECLNRVVEMAGSRVIYLSTDAAESETGLLQSLVVWDGKMVPLVQRPARNSAEKWDALLYRHGLDGDTQVDAMLDKTICALSSVFIGTSGSTFTEDILRLRKGWELASVCDEYLCQGEVPDFIAEDE